MKLLFVSLLLASLAEVPAPDCSAEHPYYLPDIYECPNGQLPSLECLNSCDDLFIEFQDRAVNHYCMMMDLYLKGYEKKIEQCMHDYDWCIHLGIKTPAECLQQVNECLDMALQEYSYWTNKSYYDYQAAYQQNLQIFYACYESCCPANEDPIK